jgi:16S rRNA U516 pseudouridylate synthase RsuA-like enzyme
MGRISLGALPPGKWRFVGPQEQFWEALPVYNSVF